MNYFDLASNNFSNQIYNNNVQRFISNNCTPSFKEISNGKKILVSQNEVISYSALYQVHHMAKLRSAYNSIDWSGIENKSINIFDWGSGQAFASLGFLEYMNKKTFDLRINNITLFEPSKISLMTGETHIKNFLNNTAETIRPEVKCINVNLNHLGKINYANNEKRTNIHLISNVLDIPTIDLDNFVNIISSSFKGTNLFICVGTSFSYSVQRIDEFYCKLCKVNNAVPISSGTLNIPAKLFYLVSGCYVIKTVKGYQNIFNLNLN